MRLPGRPPPRTPARHLHHHLRKLFPQPQRAPHRTRGVVMGGGGKGGKKRGRPQQVRTPRRRGGWGGDRAHSPGGPRCGSPTCGAGRGAAASGGLPCCRRQAGAGAAGPYIPGTPAPAGGEGMRAGGGGRRGAVRAHGGQVTGQRCHCGAGRDRPPVPPLPAQNGIRRAGLVAGGAGGGRGHPPSPPRPVATSRWGWGLWCARPAME